MCFSLLMTTNGCFDRRAGLSLSLDHARTHTMGVIRGDQPHVLDMRARINALAETIPEKLADDVLARLAAILGSSSEFQCADLRNSKSCASPFDSNSSMSAIG